MILSSREIKLVLAGKKTMARMGVSVPFKPCRYKPGRLYALQPSHGENAKTYVTVVDVREEHLGDLTLKDARREGYRTTQQQREHWEESLEGAPYDPEQSVWVVAFLHGDHTDQPRLLAARPGAPHGDYVQTTARAMRGEPEAIPAALQARYAKDSESTLKTATNGHLDTHIKRLHTVIADIRQHAKDPKTNEQLRGLERQAKSLERKLTV